MWLRVTRVRNERFDVQTENPGMGEEVVELHEEKRLQQSYLVNENSIKFIEYSGDELGIDGWVYDLMNIEHFDGKKDEGVVLDNLQFDDGYTWKKSIFTDYRKSYK